MTELVPAPFLHCPGCGIRLAEPPRTQDIDCAACGFRYFHNVATGVAAFLTCGTQLLVTRRAAAPAAGTCDLPGGFVGAGESLERALARELYEELGLASLPVAPLYLFSLPNRYHYAGVDYATTDVFFHVPCPVPLVVTAGDDVSSASWLELAGIDCAQFGLSSIRAAVLRFAAARRNA